MTRLVLFLSLIIFTHSEFAFSAMTCQQLFTVDNKSRAYQVETAFQPETMLKAAMVLRTTNDPHMLNRKIARAYAKYLEVSVDELANPKIIDWLTKSANGIETSKNITKNEESTTLDLENGYGFRLLPEDDPAFINPKFRNELLDVTLKNQGLGYSEDKTHHKLRELYNEFISQLQTALDFDLTRKSQKRFTVRVQGFFQTGSDANNALYDLATTTWRRRKVIMNLHDENQTNQDGEILFLSKIYGEGRGKMSRVGTYGNDRSLKDWVIESPLVRSLDDLTIAEVKEAQLVEDIALAEIETKLTNSKYRVGGFFIEPIIAHPHMPIMFYRTEFLLKVQELCHKYEVPVFADEILSGGARTGRFFGFMHYDGFVPDYITFGKAMFASGILKVNKNKYIDFDMTEMDQSGLYPTLAVQPEAILKGIAYLNAVNVRKLGLQAEEVGRYLIEQVRKFKPNSKVRGVGLMIFADLPGASGRLLPKLTTTKAQIDQMFIAIRKKQDEWDLYKKQVQMSLKTNQNEAPK